MKDNRNILILFITFFKIGLMTFGGGYAMITVMQKEFTAKKKWITNEEMSEMIAISESTPGSISINAATFIGNKVGGFWGSVASTMGVVLPSFIIIMVVSFFLDLIKENIIVKYAFFGLRAGVLALVIKALVLMAKQAPRNTFSYILIAGAFIAAVVFNINSIQIIGACAALGLGAMLISRKKGS